MQCVICGNPFEQARLGRPRLYCSLKCKEAAPRQRAAKKIRAARYRAPEERRRQARERTAAWRESDPERAKESERQSYLRNQESRVAAAREYREANRERTRATAKAYAKAHPDAVWRSDANRRAREKNAFVEVVDRAALYERDRGVCGLCRKTVERSDATVDHIIPLSKGGEHSYANTQIAHTFCNLSRGNRGPAQIRMLG